MSGDQGGRPTVLVVDDEEEVAAVYELRLSSDYDVRVAHGGEEALDIVDETVDVVLLDRRMADLSGDEVLERIRERGLDCRVVLITAVDPDFDILDLPLDDYLCKPVDGETLLTAVRQQLSAAEYDEHLSAYFSISSKLAVLEAEKRPAALETSEEYQELKERANELRGQLDDTLGEFDDMEDAFREVNRAPRQ
ncbi:MAG: HalX domain-containing protein [Haloarculaceae archaeon]